MLQVQTPFDRPALVLHDVQAFGACPVQVLQVGSHLYITSSKRLNPQDSSVAAWFRLVYNLTVRVDREWENTSENVLSASLELELPQ